MNKIMTITLIVMISLSLMSCGKKRPKKLVPENGFRVSKSDLEGEFFYLKSITEVKHPGRQIGSVVPAGLYLDGDKVVKFELKENSLDIVTTEAVKDPRREGELSSIVASFPIDHVDVLWRQNSRGKDTREQEVTKSRNTWDKRQYIDVDVTTDKIDIINSEFLQATSPVGSIEVDQEEGAINFSVEKTLDDGTLIVQKYSFLRKTENPDYKARAYSASDERAFGLFKSVDYDFNEYGRVDEEDLKVYMRRWDTSKDIVYYLSENFPEQYIDGVTEVFNEWNNKFEQAIGRKPLELRKNSGQKVGDLRYNMIVYVDDVSSRGLLGYGPSIVDYKTGEIKKADVFFYGSTLKRALYSEKQWRELETAAANVVNGSLFEAASTGELTSQAVAKVNSQALDPKYIQDNIFKLQQYNTLDLGMIDDLRTTHFSDMNEVLANLRTSEVYDYKRMTMLTEEIMSPIRSKAFAEEASDEELEQSILVPLIAHELGHNLGLRHNFMGSADEDNFEEESSTSSIMDYTFLSSLDSGKPGPYDGAVLKFAYGDDDKRSEALRGNYLYCTDEDIFNARFPLCNQFDSGTTLLGLVQKQFERYENSYLFNNLRGDRAFFSLNPEAYIATIQRYLLPLRLTLDNANAFLDQTEVVYSAGSETEKQVFRYMWELVGKRIEADDNTTNPYPVEIVTGKEITFDLDKITEVTNDAVAARSFVVEAFMAIILDFNRPNYGGVDPVSLQLEIRGVLYDKLVALLLLAIDTPDPLGRGTLSSAIVEKEEEIGGLFTQLISNTINIGSTRSFFPWDINIRQMAIEMLAYMAQPGKPGAELIELLRVDDVVASDPDAATITTLDGFRSDYRTAFTTAVDFDVSDADFEAAESDLETALENIGNIDLAVVTVKNRQFKTPIAIDQNGIELTSAAGILMRDSINQIEDQVTVYASYVDTLQTQIDAESDASRKRSLQLYLISINSSLDIYRRFLGQEKKFLEVLYDIYNPLK